MAGRRDSQNSRRVAEREGTAQESEVEGGKESLGRRAPFPELGAFSTSAPVPLWLTRVVKRYAWRAKIPELHPLTPRHTCATRMLRSGGNPVEVAALLGLASYTMPGRADPERAAERGEA